MQPVSRIVLIVMAAALGACGTAPASKEITGNNTGGTIPPLLAQGADVQSLANAHCARWGGTARITFNEVAQGGEVVFVCVGPRGEPTWIRPVEPNRES
jgi:putative hemolysin